MAEIIPIDHLNHKIAFLRTRNQNLVVVATNGCFDILHIGHVRSLQKAKTMGNILVVGLNSDSSIKKLKSDSRPINNENDRAEILAALDCVDIVSIFEEDTAEKFLEIVKPNVYVKGSEYNLDNLPETLIVQKYGGKAFHIPMVPGFSTTNIIEKLKKI